MNRFTKKTALVLCILSFILILAGVLRLYKLTQYPNGFNADEAAIGYNAYSLLKTGMDEYGHRWPLTFTSFGDYKAPLYFYIVLPFVAMFDVTELAVRLPSALFGVATVLLLFLLARKISGSNTLGLLAAFFLAISPWHIHFSRGGWEVNVATFFMTLGVYAFIKALKSPRWFYLTGVSFLASMYTYQSPKIVVPLLGFGLVVCYARQLWALRKAVIGPVILAVVLAIPLGVTFTSKSGYARFSGVSIFADTGPHWAINEARGEHTSPSSPVAKIFHNKVLGYGLDFLKNYSDHYTSSFLFFNGDPIDRNNVPETGEMYVFDGIFVLIGILLLMKSDFIHKRVVFLWLVIAPAAAAITFQTPHALRSMNMVVPLVLVSATGFYGILQWLSKRSVLVLVAIPILVLIISYHVGKYLHEYYVHIPMHLPLANNYGFNKLVPFVEAHKNEYERIIITDRYDQPYILFLFYSKKPPLDYQPWAKLTPRDRFGFSTVRGYDSYEFRAIKKEDLLNLKNTMIVGSNEEIPDNDPRIIYTVYFANGKPAFKILKT